MQMGFNNDVQYRDLVVHIQTEDHGLTSKKITSQVFFSGAILESRTISYESEIESIEDPAARDERVRAIMKALHRKFYQRIQAGAYDVQLPLEPARRGSASHVAVQAGEAGLETPEDLLADAGFELAGEQASLGSAYDLQSRGEAMASEELRAAQSLEDVAEEVAIPEHEMERQGFVQMGGVGSGSYSVAEVLEGGPPASGSARACGSAARSADEAASAREVGVEVRYGTRRAFRGLEGDYSDLGPLLLDALAGA